MTRSTKTPHAQSLEELKELKERYELAVNGTNDGLWDWNLLTNEVYFSPRWKEMLGFRDDELENSLGTWESRVHPDDLEDAIAHINAAHSDPSVEYNIVHRLRHKDGHWVWILDRGQTLFDARKKAVRMVGFHTDITELKELEMQLKTQNKMLVMQSRHAQMGEMISMIAHQWRQPLGSIAMGINNILVDVELGLLESNLLQDELHDLSKQVEYLSKTIDDFRNFFRQDKRKEMADVAELFLSAYEVVSKSLQKDGVEIENNFERVSLVEVFERELQQVFVNLLINASEAMRATERKRIKSRIYETKQSVFFEMRDSGGGIEEAILEKIFEPYFSTKDEKNATGLGLYMSKMIIEKHHLGKLSVSSGASGACFTIELPKNGEKEHEQKVYDFSDK